MVGLNIRGFTGALFLVLHLLVTPGCMSSKGSNPNHQLLRAAKDMRAANAGTLAIPRELEKQPLATYIVEPGDVLLIQAAELDSPVRLPGDQPVLPDGTINLGKYGQLIVSGKTIAEIEGLVKAAVLALTKDAGFITVRLVSRQSKVFYVLGAVNAPGVFPLNGRENVLDAILAAGGLTDAASQSNIILSRPSHPDQCRTVLPVCYQEIVQLGDTTTNYRITPGDRIFVPSRSTWESLFSGRCKKGLCNGSHVPCLLPSYPGSQGCATPVAETIPEEQPTFTLPLPTSLKGGVRSEE